ncbi:MAG TPA: M67 family metallopeptidase [Chitinophagales bacterium]|nr:M67 family metallopeptidase [Chitinophagales bacterium]
MLTIESVPFEQMMADAVRSFPHECCGFMFGTEQGDERSVTAIQAVHNVSDEDQRRRFRIEPRDYMKAERFADETQTTLLGIYHSHPNHPAVPSETDRVAAQPFFSYVIVSVVDGEPEAVRSWRLNDNEQFDEELLSEPYNVTLKTKT